MGFFTRRDAYRGSEHTSLPTYFLEMRDSIIRSPLYDESLFDLVDISSKLNRFHFSGGIESMADILDRTFPEEEGEDIVENRKIKLWFMFLIDECNQKVESEEQIDMESDYSSINFQSLAEATNLALNHRIKHQGQPRY